MTKMNATLVREEFAETLNRVAYRGERIILERRGKKLAALVPMEDLDLLRDIENRVDLESARQALKERGSVSWSKIKAELGL